jgi:hypothetical protein
VTIVNPGPQPSAPAATAQATWEIYLPNVLSPAGTPTPVPSPVASPVAPPPTPAWPDPIQGQTASKLSLHVIWNDDPYIMEFVRRVRPRVIKGVDLLEWMADVKAASPETVTIGRLTYASTLDNWMDNYDPEVSAEAYVNQHLETYRRYPAVDYWEGWNEFETEDPARWAWYTRFETARACLMQAQGLRAAVGGFAAGSPEYAEMAGFLPALEAAHRCGGIFTLHEGVSPIIGCGVSADDPEVRIPGAPQFGNVAMGYMTARYRYWYEGYLKPRGLGDLPLVISELAVGGIVPGSPCNGPGGAEWKPYQEWWVQQGYGSSGPEAYVQVLAWYDRLLREDPYVLGTTIFTAGARNPQLGWTDFDLHDALLPLIDYGLRQ